MKTLLILLISFNFISCREEVSLKTTSQSTQEAFSSEFGALTAENGFRIDLQGVRNNDSYEMTAIFPVDILEFIPNNIIVKNGSVLDFKKIKDNHYTFSVKPLTPEPFTVEIPGGMVKAKRFNFKNLSTGQQTYKITDELYEGLKANGLVPTLLGQKVGATIQATVKFNNPVKSFNQTHVSVKNGVVTKFEKSNDNLWLVEITAIKDGQVSALIPEGVVESSEFKFKNVASNTIEETFTDAEIDKTIAIIDQKIEKVESFDPAKLVLIIDDSTSMEDIQLKTANSLKKALEGLKGKNVRVFGYTTSALTRTMNSHLNFPSEYPILGSAPFSNYVAHYPVGLGFKTAGQYFHNYDGHLSTMGFLRKDVYFIKNGVRNLISGDFEFDHEVIEEQYTINKSLFDTSDGSVFLSSDLSKEDFETNIQKIFDGIKDVGTKGGNRELPLCTLVSLLQNRGPHAIFNDSEKVNFMIITDENHERSEPCISGVKVSVTKQNNFPIYAANIYRTFRVGYLRKCDSGTNNYCPSSSQVLSELNCIVDGENVCGSDGDSAVCTDAERTQAKAAFDSAQAGPLAAGTFKIEDDFSCTRQTRATHPSFPSSTRLRPVRIKLDDAIMPKLKDNCHEIFDFEVLEENDDGDVFRKIEGQSLLSYVRKVNDDFHAADNIKMGYLNNTCYHGATSLYRQTRLGGGEDGNSSGNGWIYVPGTDEDDNIQETIRERANSLIGESNYTISAIVNQGAASSTQCNRVADARSADIISLADKSIGICEENYDGVFDWFNTFLKFKPKDNYPLSDDVKQILSVKLSYQDRILNENEYTFSDGVLTFRDPSILRFLNDESISIKYRNISETVSE